MGEEDALRVMESFLVIFRSAFVMHPIDDSKYQMDVFGQRGRKSSSK